MSKLKENTCSFAVTESLSLVKRVEKLEMFLPDLMNSHASLESIPTKLEENTLKLWALMSMSTGGLIKQSWHVEDVKCLLDQVLHDKPVPDFGFDEEYYDLKMFSIFMIQNSVQNKT